MAYPIRTYADIYDETYGNEEYPENKGYFGHIIVRDSNTALQDYLLVGCNSNETSGIESGIRLNKKQVKQLLRAFNKWLKRISR